MKSSLGIKETRVYSSTRGVNQPSLVHQRLIICFALISSKWMHVLMCTYTFRRGCVCLCTGEGALWWIWLKTEWIWRVSAKQKSIFSIPSHRLFSSMLSICLTSESTLRRATPYKPMFELLLTLARQEVPVNAERGSSLRSKKNKKKQLQKSVG